MEVLGGQFRCWGRTERKKRHRPALEATFQGGGVAGCVYAKTATPPALAAPGVALYKLRAKPEMAEENVRKSIG
jgi:hypothetical protein